MAFASRRAFRWKQVPPLGGRLPAETLEELRTAAIYTPPSYRSNRVPYPTVYLTDAADPGGPIFDDDD
jgi:hypothetical protein